MTVDTIQQLVRIVLFALGGYFLGDAVTQGEMFQAAVGGVLSIVAFVWWRLWDSKREA